PAALLDVGNQRFDRAPTMRPIWSILDPSFCYVPSVATSVATTWRRAGWAMRRGGNLAWIAADSFATSAFQLQSRCAFVVTRKQPGWRTLTVSGVRNCARRHHLTES